MAIAAQTGGNGAVFSEATRGFSGKSVLAQLAYVPQEPRTAQDVGLPEYLIHDLFLRHMLNRSVTSITELSRAMRLPDNVISAVFRQSKHQRLIEVLGMNGNDFTFTLTSAGRILAGDRASRCSYAGPAPVPLASYHQVTRTQAARLKVDRESIMTALDDLVLSEFIVDQLGPALISQRSIFLYGGTGNGKTSIAERLYRLHCDPIVIPYALEVDGQIIILYDPVVHERLDVQVEEMDERWVVCKRPTVTVGGELVSSMLDLRKDTTAGTYAAPVQMKANNGIFIVDDFGRQMISPRDLLNRWIVPLDRRLDHLSLDYGIKFEIPFELLVVFSTNLDPMELADECFLRRIPNKIFVESLEPRLFDEIFRRVAQSRNLLWDASVPRRLRELCVSKCGELRACIPRDICDILAAIMTYERRDPRITKEDLDRAVALYFPDANRKRFVDA
jgi:hypothetical protein